MSNQLSLFSKGEHSAQTRAAAYVATLPQAAKRADAILAHVVSMQEGATRDEISGAMELPIQSVCRPVLSLIQAGLLRETEERRKTRSGRDAVVLVAIRPPAK